MKKRKFCALALIAIIFSHNLIAQTKPDALKLYKNGNYASAIDACKAEIAQNANNIESYVVLTWALIANKQYREAEYWATQAHNMAPYDHRIVEALGEAKYFLGSNNDALLLFQEYVRQVSTNGSRIGACYYYMGEIYIRQAQFNHADIALTMAVRYEPLDDTWWARLGYAREMARTWKSAAQAYSKALQLNPAQSDAQKGYARIQSRL